MMKSNYYLLSLVFLFAISGSCFSQQVISSAGTTTTSSTAQLSWTIGEPVIETFAGAGAILTQGFHQARYTVTAVNQPENPDFHLSVYPNPVSGLLVIEMKETGLDGFSFTLSGTDGKTLIDESTVHPVQQINMSTYPSGTYLLRVSGRSQVQAFKIVKN